MRSWWGSSWRPCCATRGGSAWRQTTFYPFALTARHAGDLLVESTVDGASYESELYGSVPFVGAVATRSSTDGTTAVFLVNRSEEDETLVTLDLAQEGAIITAAWTLGGDDPMAVNTGDEPLRVVPVDAAVVGGSSVRLPPLSWTAVLIGGPSGAKA
jgi:alpha-N-arabinofuranosidase